MNRFTKICFFTMALHICCNAFAYAQSTPVGDSDYLLNQASIAATSKNYDQALFYFSQVEKSCRDTQNVDSQKQYEMALFGMIICQKELKQYEEAWKYAQQLIKVPTDQKNKEQYENLFRKIGIKFASERISGKNKNYLVARDALLKVLPYTTNKDHVYSIQKDIAYCWYMEGCMHFIHTKLHEAESCLMEAYQLYKQLNLLREQAQSLHHLGNIKEMLGDATAAEKFLCEAKTNATKCDDSKLRIEILNSLRHLYQKLNRMEDHRAVCAEIEQCESASNKVSEKEMSYYLSAGDQMREMQRYNLAESYYNKFKEAVNQSIKQNKNLYLALYLDKMTFLKIKSKEYKEALSYGKESEALLTRLFPKDNPSRYGGYFSLAQIYAHLGDQKQMEMCMDSLRMNSANANSQDKAYLHFLTGTNYMVLKTYDKAYDSYSKADILLAPVEEKTSDWRMQSLQSRASCLYQMGKYAESRQLYEEYAKLNKIKYGEQSRAYSEALYYLANIEAFSGNIEKGCQLYATSSLLLHKDLQSQLRYISSEERESYWEYVSSFFWSMSAFAMKSGETNSSFTESCYNGLILSKSLLLESEKSLYATLKEEGTPDDLQNFEEITDLQTQINKLSKEYQKNEEKIIALHGQMKALDNLLTTNVKSYANYTSFLQLDYKKLQQEMKDNDVILDFWDYFSDEKEHQYIIYIIKKNQQHPQLLKVFTQKEIDHLLNGAPIDWLYKKATSSEVMKLFWEPIAPYIQKNSRIYYIPSGAIHQIALESLPMNDGRLLGENYRFIRLSSVRELAHHSEVIHKNQTATLYGGLNYDTGTEVQKHTGNGTDMGTSNIDMEDYRGNDAFETLPYTLKEVNQIEKILEKGHCEVKNVIGQEGTEESFRQMNGHSPSILHIATHGFYYTPSEAEEVDFLKGYTDAMSLSGLILSGGNAGWTGKQLPKGVLGGVITAQDIAHLDFSNTELVVLSACQTGLGKVSYEGLYGLQRAFKKAGVKTMVVTLWNVSDHITQKFMNEFYQQLTTNHWNKNKAFEAAKTAIRSKYPEPFYWAGFIMID